MSRIWEGSGAMPESSHACSVDPLGEECELESSKLGQFDAVAAVRMVISSLSILGSLSIIVSAIAKRQVWSPKVHPIFVLSVADLMLAILWVVGGFAWLRRGVDRSWCFAISLLTVILVCVTINLTLVYACLAYSNLKKTDFGNILLHLDKANSQQVWSTPKIVAVYCAAWFLPVVMVMVVFGAVAGTTGVVADAEHCSCWCMPVFGNVLPLAIPQDNATAEYVHHVRTLIASYGVLVGAHYLVVFFLLVVIYQRILKYIRKLRVAIGQSRDTNNYGATQALLAKGQSKARKRVMYFLTVFIANGFFNLVLSIAIVILESVHLRTKEPDHHNWPSKPQVFEFYLWLFVLQSVTIPVQGLLNAIVYGWTRDDFLYIMSMNRMAAGEGEEEEEESEDESKAEELEDSGIHVSNKKEYSFTRTLVILTDEDDN